MVDMEKNIRKISCESVLKAEYISYLCNYVLDQNIYSFSSQGEVCS